MITWELKYTSTSQPQLFEVECYNEQHHIKTSINNGTIRTTNLAGLHFSASYTCCVLAIYRSYEAKRICNTTKTPIVPASGIDQSTSSADQSVNVVNGVLGFIIATLVVLLAVSGVALVCLLRLRIPKR